MNTTQILLLCLCGAVFLVIAVIAAIGNLCSLKGIPNKPVGNGQHKTARFATNGEVGKTYKHIPYHRRKYFFSGLKKFPFELRINPISRIIARMRDNGYRQTKRQ